MKKTLILACLIGLMMPVAAQTDGRLAGAWGLEEVVIEEFLPASGEVVSVNTYTQENIYLQKNFNTIGAIGDLIIFKMNFQTGESNHILFLSGMIEKDLDVQIMNNVFSFSAQGQQEIKKYDCQIFENEIQLTPSVNICKDNKCFRVVYISLKRIL